MFITTIFYKSFTITMLTFSQTTTMNCKLRSLRKTLWPLLYILIDKSFKEMMIYVCHIRIRFNLKRENDAYMLFSNWSKMFEYISNGCLYNTNSYITLYYILYAFWMNALINRFKFRSQNSIQQIFSLIP